MTELTITGMPRGYYVTVRDGDIFYHDGDSMYGMAVCTVPSMEVVQVECRPKAGTHGLVYVSMDVEIRGTRMSIDVGQGEPTPATAPVPTGNRMLTV